MKPAIAILAALCLWLGGCATPVGTVKAPASWMMAKKCALPPIPTNDGDPAARAEYDAKLRECAAKRGDQVSGLQSYAKTVSKK